MSSLATDSESQKLRTLYLLREKQASAAVSEQRLAVERVIARLEKQLELIRGLQEELADLQEHQSSSKVAEMTARSLQLITDRRCWLRHDLEQEEFFLAGLKSDVVDSSAELRIRQTEWVRAHERVKMLYTQVEMAKKQNSRIEALREDSHHDDRTTGLVFNG